jgi:GR25 family glycosyltransferase involved in LPS biosynthesis
LAGKVYLINLDRHPERLAHMQAQLAGIAFERIAAVDGADDPAMTNGLTRFERACLASHRNAWRLFLSSGNEHAYFLEDDLHVRPGLAALVHDEAWVPRDAHSVKLDTYFQKVKLGDGTPVLGDRLVARLYTRHESSAAYVLTRAGAARYLALTTIPTLPADYSLFPKNPRRLGLRVYQLTPAVAVQDHLLRAEDGGQAFPTAMGSGESLQARRRSILDKLRREGRRLAGQPANLKEAIVLRTSLTLETTTVGVR